MRPGFQVILLTLSILLGACQGPTITEKPANPASASHALQVSPSGSKAEEPAIAISEQGEPYLIWVDHSDKAKPNLILQRFDAESRMVGQPVRVNPEGIFVRSWFGDPPTIAVDRDGAIYIGWNRAYADAKGHDLVMSVSRDGGTTFSDPVKVNDDTAPASHGMHSLALAGDGRVYLAWLDERNIKPPDHTGDAHHANAEPNSEVFFASSSDGGKTFSQNTKLATEVCPCCKTSVLPTNDGKLFVSWRQVLPGDFRHIAVARSVDRGETFSNGVIVSDDKWQINACPVSGAALAMNTDSSLTVAWYSAGEGQAGIYTARSTDGGETFSSRNLVSNEAATGIPTILNAGGETSIVFPAHEGLVKAQALVGAAPRVALIDAAYYPAAAEKSGRKFVCFVRKAKDASSVWLASLEK